MMKFHCPIGFVSLITNPAAPLIISGHWIAFTVKKKRDLFPESSYQRLQAFGFVTDA